MAWILLLILILLIGCSGYYLCKTSEIIGNNLGISQNWVGAIILATVTSIPELISGITAVSTLHMPELAIGNLLGGNVFNLMILVVIEFLYREHMLFSVANYGHLLMGAIGVLMMGFVLFFFLLQKNGLLPEFGHLGASSLLLPVIYLFCMKILYHFDRRVSLEEPNLKAKSKMGPKLLSVFALSVITVIFCGMALPRVGERIVLEYGLNQAFVGTIFMAMATSCPEIAVSVAAVKLRAINLAISNLLASNIFNLTIIAVDDLFFSGGAILSIVSDRNVLTLISSILMTALVLIGLVYRPVKRVFNTVSVIGLLIFVLFLVNGLVLFRLQR